MTVNDESMYLQLKKKIPECAKFSEIHAALWALCADYQIVYTAEQMESAIDTWENQ